MSFTHQRPSLSTRPKFYPPLPKPWLIRLMQALSGAIAHWAYRMDLVVDPQDLARLRPLKGDRVVWFANHPTFGEPVLMYNLSSKLGKPFYYMAAYELFQGAMGHFFQGLGVYSIRRGLVDRASLKQTIDLLQEPGCHLVIFPEGRCSFQSDRLMDFQPGGVQLAFQALSKLAKHNQGQPVDLYAIPVSIYYRYEDDLQAVVEETLVELEDRLALQPLSREEDCQIHDCHYRRLRRIAAAVFAQIEAEYDLQVGDLPALEPEQRWTPRIAALRQLILERCERQLGLVVNTNQPSRDRAYRIQAAVKEIEQAQGSNADAQNLALLRRSVERLLNLDTIYDGYIAEKPTPERFLDTLARFQRELFQIDQPRPKRNRKAHLKVGDPINFKDYWQAYGGDRNATVDQLNRQLYGAIQANLDQLASQHGHAPWVLSDPWTLSQPRLWENQVQDSCP